MTMTPNESAPSSPTTPSSSPSRYWRSLSELEGRDDFNQYLHREFPVAASEFPEGVSRRRWLQIMGASLAMAGAAGCRYPEELILPFVLRPEGRVPGELYLQATNYELAGRVYNLVIRCVDGRPIKIEPNDSHPSELKTDPYVQASILSLYDPDRARGDDGVILRREEDGRSQQVGWDVFDAYAPKLIRQAAKNQNGRAFAVITSPTASPTNVRMLGQLRQRLPEATFCRYDSVGRDVMRTATEQVLGRPAKQVLQLSEAEVVVSLQADILGHSSGFLVNAKEFARKREPLDGDMSRLYVVEGGYSQTGASADARLALRPSQIPAVLSELSRRVARLKSGDSQSQSESQSQDGSEAAFDELPADQRLERFLDVMARDVANAGDGAVVVVGEHLGAEAVAAGIRLNEQLGSFGKLQTFSAEVDASLGETASLQELVSKIDNGEIESLLILGDNPAFTAPGDVPLADAIGKVENSIYIGEYHDETAALCDWSLPLAHPLESWGDCVNDYGHYGVCQPQILPLLGGRSLPEILAVMLGQKITEPDQLVRRTADEIGSGPLSQREWRKLLHDGYLESLVISDDEWSVGGEGSELTPDAPVALTEYVQSELQDDFEVIFVPSDATYDGRFANNGWLQEMPQSLTKLTWDNAAIMSPKTAQMMQIEHGLVIALRRNGVTVELPVYVMPGCAPGVVTVAIGYGRERVGAVGGLPEEDVLPVGVDVSPIRTSDAMMIAYQVEARPRYTEADLATTQAHWAIDILGQNETEQRSRTLVREGTTALLEKVPEFADARGPHVPKVGDTGSPWEEPMDYIEAAAPSLPQWGMAIDLTKCIGCNACVIACQSENNVPIVGKEQVANSREMHWLRVDRYFQGNEENADVVQQPVACVHCETAPCEQVCPVAATVHTDDGINAMAYNRCIGTRYCGNNCPFKVRRFNFFNYNEEIGVGYGWDAYPSSIENANRKLAALVLNPEVTVRGRGVMEKCTYCIQRVEHAKIEARQDGRQMLRDGDVVTACQSACPTNAIVFGNLADPDSEVLKKHQDVRSYGMLEQLNVKPRTEYLALVRNTPARLMTRQQLIDLAELETPHHPTEDEHEGEHSPEDHGHDFDAEQGIEAGAEDDATIVKPQVLKDTDH